MADAFIESLLSVEERKNAKNIVKGMAEFEFDVAAQEKACAALLALTPSTEGDAYLKIRMDNGAVWQDMQAQYNSLVEADVPKALVQSLSKHPASAEVAKSSCRAIMFLARVEAGLKAVPEAGGIPSILALFQAHPADAAVLEQACCALRNLSTIEPNRAKIGSGGVKDIVKIMAEHPGETGLQLQACWALRNLAMSEANAAVLSESDGYKHILAALAAHSSSGSVLEHGCAAVANMSMHNSSAGAAIRSKIGAAVIDAALEAMGLPDFLSHTGVQGWGIGALRNLSFGTVSNVDYIVEKGGIKAIANALKTCPGHPGVGEQGIGCFLIMLQLNKDKVAPSLRAEGVVEVVTASVSNARASPGMKEWGRGVLQMLAQ